MTKNVDGDNICSRIDRLITDFEQSRDPESTEIGRQFAQLQRIMIENQDILSCSEGIKSINRLKNRYKDILPYDKHRVILQTNKDSDYINASFIEDFYGNCRYIAAQGPIDESLNDFFHMIWEFQITSIICTANDVEAGRFKFRRYWPDDDEESLQIGSYQIIKDQSSDKYYSCNDYVIRALIITQGDTQRNVILYHVINWPDHDIPNNEEPIFNLLLRLHKDRDSSTDSPILVHCSAGCGRTGSLIAIDLCRLFLNDEHLFLSKNYQPYPVFKIALHIRQFRVSLIQTLKQYLFVYKLFLYIMKINGNILLYSIIDNDENQTDTLLTTLSSSPSALSSSTRRPSVPLQITLRNPPMGRRLLNGSNISNSPSPIISPSEFFSSSSSSKDTPESPPPPPPSIPPRYSHKNQIEHEHIRSRNLRRKDSKNSRSDSLDTLSISPSKQNYHYISSEQGANSD